MRRKDNLTDCTGNMNAFDCKQTDYLEAKLVTMNTRSYESFLEAKDITKDAKKMSLTLILR